MLSNLGIKSRLSLSVGGWGFECKPSPTFIENKRIIEPKELSSCTISLLLIASIPSSLIF